MSFIRLNGWPISLESCEEKIQEIGGRARSHAGTPLSDIRATKRIWTCRTTPMIEQKAKALEGLLIGRGHNFSFDNDAYSGKGLAPSSTNGQGFVPALAADGRATIFKTNSSYVSAIDSVKYGTHSFWGTSQTVLNQLTDNQRDCEGTTGDFTAIDATLAMNTSYYWQGAQSLRIITSAVASGTEEGIYVSLNPVSDGDIMVGSCWAFATTNTAIKCRLNDVTNGNTSSYGLGYIKANTWCRIHTPLLTASGIDSTDFRLEIVEATDGSNVTFYVDALQLAQFTSGTTDEFKGYPWADPTITGARSRYTTNWLTPFPDLTLSYWFHPSAGLWDEDAILLHGSTAATVNGLAILYQEDPVVDVKVYTNSILVANLTTNSVPAAWSMVSVVIRRNAETGEYIYELFINGASVDTDNAGAPPNFANMTAFDLENDALILIDDLVVTPYAMNSVQLLAHYNMGKAWPRMPKFYIDGDIMTDDPLTVLAQGANVKASLTQAVQTNADATQSWHNNLRRLSFDILEV